MGRLTSDPELRYTPNDIAVTSFTLAVERSYVKSGTDRQVDFIDVVVWRQTAEFVCKYFQKGSLIAIDGRLQSRSYQDKNGNNRTAIEVNCDEVSFGETKKSREANGGYAGGGYGYDNGSQMRPEPAASQVAPAFDLPAGDSDFQELADDDGDVPF
mgnify:CR=1 FL=1